MTEEQPPQYLQPFDLMAPSRLLSPRFSPMGKHAKVTRLELGAGDYLGTLVRCRYPDGATAYYLEIPCDRMPHCDSCECSSNHTVNVTPAQVQQLRQFLH
jgi:hypothetical protein